VLESESAESGYGSLSSKLILARKGLMEVAYGPAASRELDHAVPLRGVGLRHPIPSVMVELRATFAMDHHRYRHHARSLADCSRLAAAAPGFSIGLLVPRHPKTATALDGSAVEAAPKCPLNQARLWLKRLGLALYLAVPAPLRVLRHAGVRSAVLTRAWLGSAAAVGKSVVEAYLVGYQSRHCR
jgi:hypothetical protein